MNNKDVNAKSFWDCLKIILNPDDFFIVLIIIFAVPSRFSSISRLNLSSARKLSSSTTMTEKKSLVDNH